MGGTAGKWAQLWAGNKEEFTDLTGQDKPDVKTFFGLAKKHRTGVAGKLKAADAAYAVYDKAVTDYGTDRGEAGDVDKALNKFGIAVREAQTAIDKYGSEIKGAADKMKEKGQKDIAYRGIKKLMADLDVLSTDMEKAQQMLFNRYNANRKLKEKGGKDEDTGVDKNRPMHAKSLKAGVAKLLAFVQECKGLLTKSPTDLSALVSYYNAKMQTAARDVTQPAGNLIKDGMQVDNKVRDAINELVQRNGGKAKFKDTVTAKEAAEEIKTLSQAGKNVGAWAKTL